MENYIEEVKSVTEKIKLVMAEVPALKNQIKKQMKEPWRYGEDWCLATKDITIEGVDYSVYVRVVGATEIEKAFGSTPTFYAMLMNNETGISSEEVAC